MANYDLQYEGPAIDSILDTGKKLEDDGYIFLGLAAANTTSGTPDKRVFYFAGPGSYSGFSVTIPTGAVGIFAYNGSAWVTSVINTGSIYDVSSANSGRTYASLSTAIEDIPSTARKAGMEIKFVNTSTSKYEVWIYQGTSTSSVDFTNTANWIGVDETPLSGSNNLVSSGGIYAAIQNAFDKLDMMDSTGTSVQSIQINVTLRRNDGTEEDPDWQTVASLVLPSATTTKAGLMSADDKAKITNTDGVFDISEYTASGGTPTQYASLSAALGTNGINVPQNIRKGGMSVKFVQSSDNNYVQFRCMSDEFTTDVTQWQGVDAEPIANSKNFVESGGVDKCVGIKTSDIVKYKGYYSLENNSLVFHTSDSWRQVILNIELFKSLSVDLIGTVSTGSNNLFIPALCFLTGKEPSTYIVGSEVYGTLSVVGTNQLRRLIGNITIPAGAKYVLMTSNISVAVPDATIKFNGGNSGLFSLIENLDKMKINGCSFEPVGGGGAYTQTLFIKSIHCIVFDKYKNFTVKIVQCGYGTGGGQTGFFFNVALFDGTTNYKAKPLFIAYGSVPSNNIRYNFDIIINGEIAGRISFIYKYEDFPTNPVPTLLKSTDYNSLYIDVKLTNSELEYNADVPFQNLNPQKGCFTLNNGELSYVDSNNWKYIIVSVDGLLYVETCSGASYTHIPAIIYLSSSEPITANVISNTEEYGNIAEDIPSILRYRGYPTIPTGASYAVIMLSNNYVTGNERVVYSLPSSKLSGLVLPMNRQITSLDNRVTTIEENLPIEPSVRIVRKTNTGQGEYATIAAALSASVEGDIIKIYDGVYEENHLGIKRGMTLVGIGDVEIKGHLPQDSQPSIILNYSTLECYNGAILDNLKITAKNLRYPIHADFSNGNAHWKVTNCKFIHYGNNEAYQYQVSLGADGHPDEIMNACSAWGGGTRGGDVVEIKNCEFISTGRAFSTHNNNTDTYNQYGASHVFVEDSVMISKGRDRDNSQFTLLAPLFVQSLDCPVDGCDVVISNCIINGYAVFQNSGGDGWSNQLKLFNCGKLKKAFSSYGSGLTPFSQCSQITTYQQNYQKYPITDEQNAFVNRGLSTIPIGSAVKKTANGGVALYDNTDDDFFGVALEEILPNEVGNVWYKGYISRIYLSGLRTTTINEGQSIYVLSDGTFALSGTKKCFNVIDNENAEFL